jgi:hypothetical protein
MSYCTPSIYPQFAELDLKPRTVIMTKTMKNLVMQTMEANLPNFKAEQRKVEKESGRSKNRRTNLSAILLALISLLPVSIW